MKILSWNVNGYNSSYHNGCFHFLKDTYDIICFQEVRLKTFEKAFSDEYGYYENLCPNGRNGVIIFSKKPPLCIEKNMGNPVLDHEGRFLRVDFKDFTVINFYMPHGKRDKTLLDYKIQIAGELIKYIDAIKDKNVIIATDFNIAHTDIDLVRAKSNVNNTMFTREERQKIDGLLDLGFIDAYRQCNPDGRDYSWWTYAFNARKRNIGWRIDYFFISGSLGDGLSCSRMLTDQMGSDHCPLVMELTGI